MREVPFLYTHLNRLIQVTTGEGELVADPFGGVASTAVAAKGLGRRFWSCEIDPEYHRLGLARLREGESAKGNEA